MAGRATSALQRWLPQSLFGRLLLVLVGGLLVAQLLSAAINVAERERLVSGSFGLQPAQRIADVVRLLDGVGPAERQRVVAVLRVPPLVLSLLPARPGDGAQDVAAAPGWHERMFGARLRALLGDGRAVRTQPRADFAPSRPMAGDATMHPGWMGGRGMMGPGMMMDGPAAAMHILRVDVQLRDGSWARFDTELPESPQALPWRLVSTLAVLLISVLVLSYVAVRWVVRPLQRLTEAAQALGEDLNRPPLPVDGPREVQQAARAFNTMQQRLSAFIDERTRMLTALSHDLKTPLTRMRLRADLMDDDEQRLRFEADLKEMEAMVTQTLEFMRGLGGNEARQPVDLAALLAALQSENEAMGRSVGVEGVAHAPLTGAPSLLKRALANLIDNAVLYGGRATVQLRDTGATVEVHVLDDGPGIPQDEIEQVFEPFRRLEGSRNRATGGTGLGLGIARNIARLHGGDVALHNRPGGGLDAVLTLSRPAA